jgi:hypothetical protein
MRGEHRFDLAQQRIVIAAFADEKGVARRRVELERIAEQVVDPLSSRGVL